MSDSWRDCEGQIIDGRFQLLQHLGGSDHSVVFSTERGKDKNEKAAIKFIQAGSVNADVQLARWKQAAQNSHPNLIRLFENGRCQLAGMDLLYVVMEYAQENLAQFLPERALSPAETRDMLEPFLETLAHLHGKGFAHGRIKPGNILAIDDQLKLSSDSLCRIGESQPSVGKPDAHTAPEFNGTITASGDVWSLGVTLAEALSQRVPEQKPQGELQIPDSIPQPFLDIIRHTVKSDSRTRWTVAEIATRLNPPVAVLAPKVSASAPAIPDPIKPAAVQPPAGASASAAPTSKATSPVKSAGAIDPLSVPLSNVAPLPPARQHSLENQTVSAGITPNRSYYVVVAVLVALTVGAMLAIPRFRDRQSAPDTTSAPGPSTPAVQPLAPAESKPQAKLPKKQAPPAQERAIPGRAERSAVQPSRNSPQEALKSASDTAYVKKDAATAGAALPVRAVDSSNASASAFSGGVTPGEVLNQVLPEVSAKSRRTIRGTLRIVVKVKVDASGTVTEAEPASSPSKFFGEAAAQAAKQWDFAPAKVAGQAVPSEWLVRFDFTQADTKALPSQTRP
jgi:TonB family protein